MEVLTGMLRASGALWWKDVVRMLGGGGGWSDDVEGAANIGVSNERTLLFMYLYKYKIFRAGMLLKNISFL